MDPAKNPYNSGRRTSWHKKMMVVFLVLLVAAAFFTYELMLSKRGQVAPGSQIPTPVEKTVNR
ncbi:MAG TPA: hypothetical protein VFV50_07095 [Bdellovibrionales bacterium]|nr:hypothetical protein [Bdellovibrionales bacterium]